MKSSDLILHPRSARQLENVKRNLPHALIIEGSVGVGVLQVAKEIARSVGSPEFVIFPKKKVKNEFAIDMNEGNIVIEDVRSLYAQTRTKQPGRQVYIFDTGLRSMTVGAQNALLKLLEEPQNGTHFIIATHNIDQLLPTIVSRSQKLSLLNITTEQTQRFIDTLGIIDDTKTRRLAFVGRGKPALIKRLLEDKDEYDARVAIMTDAKTILGSDIYTKLVVLQKYKENRSDSLTLLEDMIYQLRIILKSRPDRQLVYDIDRYVESRERIGAGGNIRLQLASSVL